MDASDREGLERLCRYGLRAPFSQERLHLREDGRVVYELPRPWPHSGGVSELVLEGPELLSRLAALVPAPYLNTTRYHGCFASRSKWRSRLPAPSERKGKGSRSEEPSSDPSQEASGSGATGSGAAGSGTRGTGLATSVPPCRRSWVPWAALLSRVFYLDALRCAKCGGKRKVLAFLTDPHGGAGDPAIGMEASSRWDGRGRSGRSVRAEPWVPDGADPRPEPGETKIRENAGPSRRREPGVRGGTR
ncbi:MAG: transposase [Candidatus Eisenbacteria bacterium]|uniref:Transposase n=1 Tax=Eiseniibacteriota bacterium TaxID=2212470 RepID=A0A956NHU8_UNCEI|nr:transposase [Candidatus Eisenbacteria bacterium]